MSQRARTLSALAGAALLASVVPVLALPTVAEAQAFNGPMGVTGRWAIDLPRSKFNALTGPPPLSGELDVTIDDGKSLAWTLVEVDEAGVAALQFAHAVLDGPTTQAVVNLNLVTISVQRVGQAAVTVMTHGEKGSRRQSMKVTRTDDDTLLVEQDIDGKPGPPDQTLILVRVK